MRSRGLSYQLRDRLLNWLYEYQPLRDKEARDAWLLALPEDARNLITRRHDHYKYDLNFIVEAVRAQRLRDGRWLVLILVDAVLSEVQILDMGAHLESLRRDIERELQPRRPCPAWEDLIHIHPEFAQVIHREGLVQEIRQYLAETSAAKARPIVLYGQSMAGKTSILHRLCEVLGNAYAPLLVMLQSVATSSLGPFLRDLALQLTKGFNDTLSLSLKASDQEVFGEGNEETISGVYWGHLREMANGKQLVVIFDEVDYLLDQVNKELDDASDRELGSILAFFDHFVHNPGNGHVILTGSEHILHSSAERLGLLTEARQLDVVSYYVPYDDRIAEQCLYAAQDYVEIENHVLECLARLCDGHPRVVQDTYEVIASVANQWSDKHRIERDDIKPIVSKVITGTSGALQALWLRLLPSERDVVERASKRPFVPWAQDAMDFFECHLRDLSASADVNYDNLMIGARSLAERNLIEWKNEDEDLFCFKLCALPLWRRWHRAHQGTGDRVQ